MVVRDNPGFLRLFLVVQGSILPKTLPKVIVITLVAILTVLLYRHYPVFFHSASVPAFTLLGISLSLFLGFRNHASYERWWEGRKLWGTLTFYSRNLNREMHTFFCSEDEISRACRTRIAHLNIAFIYAARNRLRQMDDSSSIKRYLEEGDDAFLEGRSNLGVAILQLMGRDLGRWHAQGYINSVCLRDLNHCLNELSVAYCSCERTFTTPIPFGYMLLLHRTAYIYCLLLPWGVVASIGAITPIISALIAYTFFGFDALSEELASPFGNEPNCLAINAMTRQIEIETLETSGSAAEMPVPLVPENHILS